MTVAESIARWLSDKGITHAFGIVGGGNNALWGEIAEFKKTKLVCVHHEQAATMAASYYYRTCGRVALALVTTGGGSTNAITGVVAAWMDRVPLLVISGNEASRYMNNPQRVWGTQGYNSSRLVEDVTKRSDRIKQSDWTNWTQKLDLALAIALKPPQGPVWIDIPGDIQRAMV